MVLQLQIENFRLPRVVHKCNLYTLSVSKMFSLSVLALDAPLQYVREPFRSTIVKHLGGGGVFKAKKCYDKGYFRVQSKYY